MMQLAGAGSPIKYLCSVFVKLNFDSLKAVAIVIINPAKDKVETLKLKLVKSENISVSVNPDLTSNLYITKPGTNPLVIKSENESNCFPSVLSAFSKRAKKPSAKSNKKAKRQKITDVL